MPELPAPELPSATDYRRVAAAIAYLDAHATEQPDLATLAAALHLSPSHLQRTFSRFAGTSPKRLLAWLTADAARRLLRERRGVLAAAAEVGLSSPGRLHDLVVATDAVTPGTHTARGEGLTVSAAWHDGPLGTVLVAVTDRGVCALRFVDAEPSGGDVGGGRTPAAARALLADQWPRARVLGASRETADVAAAVGGALATAVAGRAERPVPLLLRGTNLQLRVWAALLRLPEGAVTTYGELARAAGRPDAVRAVASAVGRNPVGVLVPCHRVLRATGGIGGYRWGEVRKRALLAREAARFDAQQVGEQVDTQHLDEPRDDQRRSGPVPVAGPTG